MAADLWNDLKLALAVIFFIYLVQWTCAKTGSKKIGIIVAAIIAYFTFFSHAEILWFVLIFFFAYPFFDKLAGEWKVKPK